ncbi:hypothetical protein COC42_08080 [Sphingomonas spermidinifaciens]|uniref:Uncharacterized protein n=1 Tax=Sphingomonas spermidinifaciens TaxID=1141889 RepID=A0A2A4B9D1_9SPHN|nr:hypothetical protein [Sphingomonas spermidinifaciens]PCD04234.1 hypothetical protein COC42_08080 [Sphingomonas spermidinifaciens]
MTLDRPTPPEDAIGTPRRRSTGRPIVATVICALLLIGSCVGQQNLPRPDIAGQGELVGRLLGGALFAALLWGIAFVVTIRRASRRARLISLSSLLALGVLTQLVALNRRAESGRAVEAERTQAREVAAQVDRIVESDGNSGMTARPDAAPLTQLLANGVNQSLGTTRRFKAEADAAGLAQVTSFEGLTTASPVLDRCDRVAALAGQAAAAEREIADIQARVTREGEAMVARGELSATQFRSFLRGAAQTQPRAERQWQLTGALATDGAALCEVLARRRWQKDASGAVLFTDRGDLTEARPLLARIATASREMNRLASRARNETSHFLAKSRTN